MVQVKFRAPSIANAAIELRVRSGSGSPVLRIWTIDQSRARNDEFVPCEVVDKTVHEECWGTWHGTHSG